MTPNVTAFLNQQQAQAVELMLKAAARYDHLDEHEATAAMMISLIDSGLNLIGATSTACIFAIREHRRGAQGGA